MAHQTFNNSYLWDWMGRGERTGDHSPLTDYLDHDSAISRGVLEGITPDFISQIPPSPPDPRKSINQMSNYVPQWLWQQMLFCGRRYHDFFMRLWPQLASVARDLVYLEWLLYVEPGYMEYREHLVHMFKVACLGTWFLSDDNLCQEIIERQFRQDGHLDKWTRAQRRDIDVRSFSDDEKKSVCEWGFLLAAMLHDFGYAYYHRAKFDERVSSLYQWLPHVCENSEPTAAVQQSLDKSLAIHLIGNRLACSKSVKQRADPSANRRRTGFVRDVLVLNHGMSSCLFVLDLKDRLDSARALNTKLRLALEIAAEAAMLHELVDEKQWCGLRPHQNRAPRTFDWLGSDATEHSPVAALLMLCDELAMWERPCFEPPSRNRPFTGVTYEFDLRKMISMVRVDLELHDLKIGLRYRGTGHEDHQKLEEKLGSNPVFNNVFFGREIHVDRD